MDHRTFIQSLSGEQRRTLTQRTNHHALIRLSVLLCCFLISSAAILIRLPLLPLWLFVQGLLLVSLFHLLHECVHDTVFVQRLPNRILAHLCGFVLFLPAIWFRYFHHAHHRYTQTDKDPELESEKPIMFSQWIIHISGVTVWRAQLGLLFRALFKPCTEPYLKEDKQVRARMEMLLMLFGYLVLLLVSVISANPTLLYLWIFPLLLGQPFLRLYLLAEHTGCEAGANMLRNTRTVLTNPVVRWFTWNMPYHTEHHVYPSVPFHQLPLLHGLIKKSLVEVDSGYIEFNKAYVLQVAGRAGE